MQINLTEKRMWAKQRKIEADAIRKLRKNISDSLVEEGMEFPAWAVMGCILGCGLLILFAVIQQMAGAR